MLHTAGRPLTPRKEDFFSFMLPLVHQITPETTVSKSSCRVDIENSDSFKKGIGSPHGSYNPYSSNQISLRNQYFRQYRETMKIKPNTSQRDVMQLRVGGRPGQTSSIGSGQAE